MHDRIPWPDGSLDSAGTPVPALVPIPGGQIEIGTKTIEVAPFLFGRTPLTNREYAPFLATGRASTPPWWKDPAFSAPLQPVVGVTWEEAMGYCAWIGETAGGRWRLPTEAEWQLAVSGGLPSPQTAWGERVPEGEIPEGPLAGPWEAGRGTPNRYGILDAGTIVHEWCMNWHEPEETSRALPRRASRGGSWRHRIRWSSPSARSSLPPGYRYSDYGFRVLREAGR